MADLLRPLDSHFAQSLYLAKSDVVQQSPDAQTTLLTQFGAASLPTAGRPPWPTKLDASTAVIETFVASAAGRVQPMSDNEPYVTAWQPLAQWLAETVQAALEQHGVLTARDAYLTASLTPTAQLEGLAHMDDNLFIPHEGVGVVAIIGQHAGPRMSIGSLAHAPLRPMTQVQFNESTLDHFGEDPRTICAASADQIAVFPQFAQLHAGPAACHIESSNEHRQLLVYRAKTEPHDPDR